ncbi:uncharacterized protein [Narcine bancroftii]|uniref:uncharacterized protein isoform X3 n=1 Tax=Narcine bancroftii TaxID=1343680 RepID=UPI0038318EF2
MAVADLLAVVSAVILRRIRFYFSGSFLDIYPYCNIIFVLMCATRDCSVWFTVNFTFDRFVLICCQKMKTKYCTGKTAAVILGVTGVLMCLKNVPFYFTSQPREIIDNVPWFCDRKSSYYTDPGWVEYSRFDKVVVPLVPFAVILLFNILTVRHILLASRVRKALMGQSKGVKRSDPEMESRRSVVGPLPERLWVCTSDDGIPTTSERHSSGAPHRPYVIQQFLDLEALCMPDKARDCTGATTDAILRSPAHSMAAGLKGSFLSRFADAGFGTG